MKEIVLYMVLSCSGVTDKGVLDEFRPLPPPTVVTRVFEREDGRFLMTSEHAILGFKREMVADFCIIQKTKEPAYVTLIGRRKIPVTPAMRRWYR